MSHLSRLKKCDILHIQRHTSATFGLPHFSREARISPARLPIQRRPRRIDGYLHDDDHLDSSKTSRLVAAVVFRNAEKTFSFVQNVQFQPLDFRPGHLSAVERTPRLS
jgi:hypothetical protein